MPNLTAEQQQSFAKSFVDSPDVEADGLTPVEQQAVNRANAETQALMVMKAELTQTTSTRGFSYIQKFAETIVRDMEKEAIAEEDDIKANGLRRDARGARKFKDELFRRIGLAKNQEPSNFLEVSTD